MRGEVFTQDKQQGTQQPDSRPSQVGSNATGFSREGILSKDPSSKVSAQLGGPSPIIHS